jgi:hypothetical protein
MDDKAFRELGLKLSICPTQHRWPRPDIEVFTQDGAVTAKGLHWSRNHDAADWMRDYTAKVLTELTAINADKTLSPVGKTDKKKLLAAKAKPTIEKSKMLAQAKDASKRQLAKWEKEFESQLKPATTPHATAVYAKLWDRCHELEGAERLAWLNKHATDTTFVSALLTAPAAVTGLKPDEFKLLREQFEQSVQPEIVENKSLTLLSLDDLDRGARNAINKICQAAGVKAHELDADTAPMGLGSTGGC